jgi:GNAT superfamily N-acetyltransferase
MEQQSGDDVRAAPSAGGEQHQVQASRERRDGTGLDRPGGSFYGFHRDWPLPALQADPGGQVEVDTIPDVPLLAKLARLDEREVVRRLDEGHQLFLLRVDGAPASYGWSASGPAHIGGLELHLTVPPGERYLWDFVTLPDFRGRGLYPLLLQDIIRRQWQEASWFWIGHETHNEASRRGILKAGFRLAGRVWWLRGGELGFIGAAETQPAVAHGAARALGLKHLHTAPGEDHPATEHA